MSSDSSSGGVSSILKKFDKDGDGQITENDFVLIARELGMGKLGEYVIRAAFKKVDKNKNGKLDTSEILELVKFLKKSSAQ